MIPIYFVMALLLPIGLAAIGDPWVRVADSALIYGMLALGLNVIVGYAGLLDLGFLAFFATGAYSYALWTSPHLIENIPWIGQTFPTGFPKLPFLVLVFMGALLAACAGALQGLLVRRLRGDYLALATLGFGESVRILLNNLDSPVNLTNGPQGIANVPPIQLFGWDGNTTLNLSLWNPHWLPDWLKHLLPPQCLSQAKVVALSPLALDYYVLLFFVIAMVWLLHRIEKGRIGRAWMALREDEMAATAVGVDAAHVKLLAFATGGAVAGAAGVLFAALQGFVSPENFSFMESAMVIAMVVLGGSGHSFGVLLGAFVLYAFPEVLRSVANPAQMAIFGRSLIPPEAFRMLLFGLALVGVMRWRPHGLWEKPT